MASGLFPLTLRRSLLAPALVSLIGIVSMSKGHPRPPFETTVVLYHRTKAIRPPSSEPVRMRPGGLGVMVLDGSVAEVVSTLLLQLELQQPRMRHLKLEVL